MLLLLLACAAKTHPPKTGEPEVPAGCRGAEVSGDRSVLLSFPYDRRSNPADTWGRWILRENGNLEPTSEVFSMGRAVYGEAVFTPDGSLAIATAEDGTLSVYADGPVTTGMGTIYAEHIVMDPSGEKAWAIDGNWLENGGGIYPLTISCDSPTVTLGSRWLEATLPAALVPRGEEWVVVGQKVGGADPQADAALVDAEGKLLAAADAFGDNEAVVTSGVLTQDQQYLLIADNAEYSGVPTRVAVVEVGDDTLRPRQILEIEDPIDLFVSPDDRYVVVVSGYGNTAYVLERQEDPEEPFRNTGEIAWEGASPQLPGPGTMVETGPLAGLILLPEVGGVHLIRTGDGVEDGGMVESAGGTEGIVGAIGTPR